MIEFDDTFYDLEREINNFMIERYQGLKCKDKMMWKSAIDPRRPLMRRLNTLIVSSKNFVRHIENRKRGDPDHFNKQSVLDLGCGFCQYWPFLEMYGFNDFVGVDLYSLRGLGQQKYMETAEDLARKFCKESKFKIYECDANNLESILDPSMKFDFIFAMGTQYSKLGASGIYLKKFNKIVEKRLKSGGFYSMGILEKATPGFVGDVSLCNIAIEKIKEEILNPKLSLNEKKISKYLKKYPDLLTGLKGEYYKNCEKIDD